MQKLESTPSGGLGSASAPESDLSFGGMVHLLTKISGGVFEAHEFFLILFSKFLLTFC